MDELADDTGVVSLESLEIGLIVDTRIFDDAIVEELSFEFTPLHKLFDEVL